MNILIFVCILLYFVGVSVSAFLMVSKGIDPGDDGGFAFLIVMFPGLHWIYIGCNFSKPTLQKLLKKYFNI